MIHALHPNLFEHVPNLEKLNLKGNPLRIISHGTILAISCIPLLKVRGRKLVFALNKSTKYSG